jgi:hypothetical protein
VATDLLAKIRTEIDERLAQLRPLLSEYERLTAAAETLAALDDTPLAAVGAAPRLSGYAPPPAAVDTEDESSYEETPYAEPPYPPPGRALPGRALELSAEAPPTPSPSPEAPRLPSDAPVDPAEEPPTPAPRRTYPLRGSDGAIKLAMSLRTTPLQRPTPRFAAQPAAPTASATQVLERPPLPPAVEGDTWEPSTPPADRESAPEPPSPAAVRQAILAALEHGSHTASELVMVTAMSTPEIRGGLIRLVGRGAITKVKRRGDGKTAYALPFSRA